MEWFLFDRNLRRERVKDFILKSEQILKKQKNNKFSGKFLIFVQCSSDKSVVGAAFEGCFEKRRRVSPLIVKFN